MGREKRNTPSPSNSPPPEKSDASHAGVSPTSGYGDDIYQEQGKNESLNSTSRALIITECERARTHLRRGNPAEALRLMKEACLRFETSALLHHFQGILYAKVASLIEDNDTKQLLLKNAVKSGSRAVSLLPDDVEGYRQMLRDYRRVVLIDNPIDPDKDSLQDDSQLKAWTAEAPTVTVRQELRSESEDAATPPLQESSENHNNGDGEDPMEASLCQTLRPNEIKAKQTPEKPTEIEVREEAARLLQPKWDNDDERLFGSSSWNNVNQIISWKKRTGEVRWYWNSMSGEEKRGLLEIRICDLKAYFRSFKDCLADEILSEAIDFSEKKKTWRFWACCSCDEKFIDAESHMQHLQSEHMGNLLPELQSILPLKVDTDWFELFLNSPWKPVDTPAAVTMIQRQLDNLPNEDCRIESSFKERKAKLLDEMLRHWQVGNGMESEIHDEYYKFRLSEFDWNSFFMARTDDWKWPLSNNSERTEILEKTRGMLQFLLRHEYLAVSHLNEMIQYTMKELQTFLSASQILSCGLEETPLCICFLEISQLKSALAFLQQLSHICGLNMFSQKGTTNGNKNNDENLLEIAFTRDLSCLILDEHLLHDEHHIYNAAAAARDGFAAACAVGDHEVDVPSDSDAFVYWLFGGPPIGEQLASWTDKRDDKKHEGIKILQVLEKEFSQLQRLCGKKSEQLSHRRAWQIIESICVEELMTREQGERYSPQSYGTLLRERIEKLVECDYDSMSSSSRVELSVISSILDEASSLCEKKCSEDNEYRMSDYLHIEENCIKVVIQWRMSKTHAKLCEIDARILRILTDMNQLESKLVQVSAYDYRSIMVPLVKSFMLVHLEDLVHRDTAQKSDAAREIGGDQTKYTRKKLKDATVVKEHVLHLEDAEQVHFPVANELKGQKEKIRHKVELEAEEKKFQERSKNQIQSENEAKLKQLEEQNMKSYETIPSKLLETLDVKHFETEPEKLGDTVVYSKPGDAGEPLTGNNDDRYSEGLPAQGTLDDSVLPSDQQTGGLHDALQAERQGMPQKVTSKEDSGVFSTDATVQKIDGSDIFGTGLRNDGENNCFLNVIIQSLWHLGRFQQEFLSGPTSWHAHISEPCVVCALYDIFNDLNSASTDPQRKVVATTSLRVALSNFSPDSNCFQLEQMNDTSEALGVIFDCLHQSFTSNCGVSATVSEESMGSRECASSACIVHTLFGMDICERMECRNCGVESRKIKYTTFFRHINSIIFRMASTLRKAKIGNAESPFDDPLKLAEMEKFACDPEAGGCGKLNCVHHQLLNTPHVFTIVIGWQTTCESAEIISATLTAFPTEIDIGVLYQGLDPGNRHCLVSMICYCRQHYICLAYSHDSGQWIMFSDEDVQVIGCWDDVLSMCERRCLQPQVLFFEAVK